jgi:hypothetical protein
MRNQMHTGDFNPATIASAPSSRRILRLLGVVMLLLSATRAQSPSASEYQVKAAFLYNFAKFVEWPASSFSGAAAPLRICVYGQDPFGPALRDIANDKSINGRKLEVDQAVDLPHARICHILFIASSEKTAVKQILEGVRGAGVLTVADSKGFVGQGGMINFVLEDDRVKFEVSPAAAERAGLKISSKLLSVAKLVVG